MRALFAGPLLVSLALFSCSPANDTPDVSALADAAVIDDAGPADDAGVPLPTEPDFRPVHSRFGVEYSANSGIIALSGSFARGPAPEFHVETARSGNCRQLTYTASTCAPACTGRAVCIEGECLDYPERYEEGTLSWEWSDGSAEVSADGTGGYFSSAQSNGATETSLSFNGQTLSVDITDAALPESDWFDVINSRDGGDVELRWSNPIAGSRVRLRMTDCDGSHGGLGETEIECEGPDVGSLTIPAEYMDAFDNGFWGRGECGSHILFRYQVDTPEDDNTLRFEAFSRTNFYYRPE